MTADLEKSIKSKLRTIAAEKKRDPADLWQTLILERFLVRLSHSAYQDHFVLKGATLLSKYIEIGRETRDLDFYARNFSNELEKIKLALEQITKIDLKDGFSYGEVQISPLMHEHMDYTGAVAVIKVFFGRIRATLNIDIGFGDIVNPVRKSISLTHYSKGALFENSIELACYPKEFIFAEKLETLVYRKQTNSRMKDFHDLHSLILSSHSAPFENLKTIVHAVFDHRQTPFSFPIEFGDEGISQLQKLWESYLKNLRVENGLPQHISEIILNINRWMQNNL